MKMRMGACLAALALVLAAPVALAGEQGDCNGDGTIDSADVSALQAAIGTAEGDEGFVAECDHDGNGAIAASDLGAQLRLAGGN